MCFIVRDFIRSLLLFLFRFINVADIVSVLSDLRMNYIEIKVNIKLHGECTSLEVD
jgi:hypothetical protein